MGITQRPLVHVHRLHRAEAVESLELVDGRGESVDSLQEGVVSELEGRVQGDRCRQCFAPHLGEGRQGGGLWRRQKLGHAGTQEHTGRASGGCRGLHGLHGWASENEHLMKSTNILIRFFVVKACLINTIAIVLY